MKVVWYGFKKPSDDSPFCMLQQVASLLDFISINKEFQELNISHKVKIGEWILSWGGCQCPDGIQIAPPFKEMQQGMDYAAKLGALSFIESFV